MATEVTAMATIMDDAVRKLLAEQYEFMKCPPFNTPPEKLEEAYQAVQDEHVSEGTGTESGLVDHWIVQGRVQENGHRPNYVVTAESCSCPGGTKGRKAKYYCYHAVAVELYRRWQRELEPSLFARQPTVDERLAQPATEALAVSEGTPTPATIRAPARGQNEACMRETGTATASGQDVTPETLTMAGSVPDITTAAEIPLEPLRMAQEPSLSPHAMQLTRRPIGAIVADLSRVLPAECVDTLTKGGTTIHFLHWHTVAAVLDAYAPGWEGAVVRVDKIGERLSVTYRITIPAAEGLCSREDSGMEDEDKDDFGDAMTNATATAFKRTAAKFGVGRWLYDGKAHTEKFIARLRGDREQLLKSIEEATHEAGVPFERLLPWLMSQTGAYHRGLIPVWALRSLLAQLQRQTPPAA